MLTLGRSVNLLFKRFPVEQKAIPVSSSPAGQQDITLLLKSFESYHRSSVPNSGRPTPDDPDRRYLCHIMYKSPTINGYWVRVSFFFFSNGIWNYINAPTARFTQFRAGVYWMTFLLPVGRMQNADSSLSGWFSREWVTWQSMPRIRTSHCSVSIQSLFSYDGKPQEPCSVTSD